MPGRWLMTLAVVGATAAAPVVATRPPNRLPSTICGSGHPRDVVQIRVFPIGIQRRIFPSPDEIITHGGNTSMVRKFWQTAMAGLCNPRLPAASSKAPAFSPRIVVYVEGERDRAPLLLEYPDWRDGATPVRASINGKIILVPATIVRRLLDYSRSDWRD